MSFSSVNNGDRESVHGDRIVVLSIFCASISFAFNNTVITSTESVKFFPSSCALSIENLLILFHGHNLSKMGKKGCHVWVPTIHKLSYLPKFILELRLRIGCTLVMISLYLDLERTCWCFFSSPHPMSQFSAGGGIWYFLQQGMGLRELYQMQAHKVPMALR